MRRRTALAALLPLPAAPWPARAQPDEVVVIAHPGVSRIDGATLQRVYTGRVVEIDGRPVTPVNAVAGSPVRTRFLQTYLQQDDEKYIAYWTVRRYIGKGVPPRELPTADEVIRFVQTTPGAIGYVTASNLTGGVNVLLR